METSHLKICIIFMLIIIVAASESGLVPDGTGTDTGGNTPPLLHAPVAEPHRGPENCHFEKWEGSWFQSGVHQTIAISRNTINTKGRCLEANGEKYLFFNERENCYRCVVFHEKHFNLLQYKESFCVPERTSIRNLCSLISGDANLFAMFRLDAAPIDCPFRAPMTFTYNRGHGECRNPVSTVESCMMNNRLLFNYQACPDVPSTESTAEELSCLANWKEGSYRYLVGLIQYRHHASYEERFRCFVYEKVKKGSLGLNLLGQGYSNNVRSSPLTFNSTSSSPVSSDGNVMFRVAQSGDATCNGLGSTMEGALSLTLRRAQQVKPCYFPSWLHSVHPRWQTLDVRTTFIFDSSTMKVANSSSSSAESVGNDPNTFTRTAVCVQILENPSLDEFTLILHTTSAQCRNGYICARFFRRDTHIVELQFGTITRSSEDACHNSNFNSATLPYTTLASTSTVKKKCPTLGRFGITSLAQEGRTVRDTCVNGYHSFSVGCSRKDTMEFRAVCTDTELISEYSCHGWWEENGINYLITRAQGSSGSHRKYCFVYRDMPIPFDSNAYQQKLKSKSSSFIENDMAIYRADEQDNDFGRVMQFSSIADSCRRDVSPGIEGFLAFNVTSKGRCNDISGSSKASFVTELWLFAINMAVAVTIQ